jgi:deoxyribodipyrimidine photo-lyase
MIDKRARLIQEGKEGKGPVIYWMSRDQRMHDNWALLYAQRLALKQKSPLVVLFCIVPRFLGATIRQYGFMLRGLEELEAGLHKKNIAFLMAAGRPDEQIPRVVKELGAACLITDFDPLRIKREWKTGVAKNIDVPFHEVDAHNIVPCWIASVKQEYAAYTFRPKIHRLLPEFLDTFPSIKKHPVSLKGKREPVHWNDVYSSLKIDHEVKEVDWLKSGEKAAKKTMKNFAEKKLPSYEAQRNDPTLDGQSGLSPYLHFGHISAQRAALDVQASHAPEKDREAFLEELVVRRELSDNFCFYNDHYDSFEGFPSWAKASLDKHAKKPREYVYSLEQFEQAATHDELWNAAQQEMLQRGKMHGYMRMYWAKKILEWTESPGHAMEIAIYLNDKYELDGRDPNGYAGIAWSIGGVHDRAWNERRIFGKIRYMSYNGCRGKFDVKKYIERYGENS